MALGKPPFLNGSEDHIRVIKCKVMNNTPDYPSQMDPDLCDILKRVSIFRTLDFLEEQNSIQGSNYALLENILQVPTYIHQCSKAN